MHLKRLQLVLLTGSLILYLGAGNLWAAVGISPAYVELSLDKKRPAGKFVIRNTGEKTERYRIKASHFELGTNGELIKLPPNKNSLVPWIKFNPKEFSLPPKSRRAVRFVIVPRGKLPDKAYWAFMELEPLKANVAKSKDADGRTFSVNVLTSILVPIFATKGKLSYDASIEDIKIVPQESGTGVEVMVTNKGKGIITAKVNYEILDTSGNVVNEGLLGKSYIFPSAQRKFCKLIDTEIPKGDYTVKVVCESRKLKKTLTKTIQHAW